MRSVPDFHIQCYSKGNMVEVVWSFRRLEFLVCWKDATAYEEAPPYRLSGNEGTGNQKAVAKSISNVGEEFRRNASGYPGKNFE